MSKTYRQRMAEKHARNTLIVHQYLKLIKNKNAEIGPAEIYREHNISRQRFYQILKNYGVHPTYREKVMER